MLRSQAPSSSSFFLGSGAPSPTQDFSEDGEYSRAGQGMSLLHGKSPFHGMMQLPEQHSSTSRAAAMPANGNLLNLGHSMGWHWQRRRLGGRPGRAPPYHPRPIQRQRRRQQHPPRRRDGVRRKPWLPHERRLHSFPVQLISIGRPTAELSDGAPDEGGPAQMGSTSSADTGPSALLRAVGFGAARGGGQGTSRGADGAAEATSSSHAAHFHDLIMNSLAGGGGFSCGAAGFGAMDDDGNLSTQDFLGVGGAPDPAQMN